MTKSDVYEIMMIIGLILLVASAHIYLTDGSGLVRDASLIMRAVAGPTIIVSVAARIFND